MQIKGKKKLIQNKSELIFITPNTPTHTNEAITQIRRRKLNCLYKWFTNPSTGKKTPKCYFPVIQLFLYWYGKASIVTLEATHCFVNIPCVKEEKSYSFPD